MENACLMKKSKQKFFAWCRKTLPIFILSSSFIVFPAWTRAHQKRVKISVTQQPLNVASNHQQTHFNIIWKTHTRINALPSPNFHQIKRQMLAETLWQSFLMNYKSGSRLQWKVRRRANENLASLNKYAQPPHFWLWIHVYFISFLCACLV